ncbi:hypothetical protein E2C01_050991 [Portunus trituberculatus]|uniref:Uncharacterized protein n=1 Tax=Portunus trituberculatus TaxID=210409 RepID=A0A5B7GHW3_PORTR|nr:hypothetical protein [Portunus trituberculatus]
MSPDPPSSSHGWEERRWRWARQYEEEQWTLGLLPLLVPCIRLSRVQLQPHRSFELPHGMYMPLSSPLIDYPSTSRTLDRGHTGRRPTSVIGYSSLARGEDRKPSLYRSQGAGLNYGEDYRVHEARRPSLAVEGGGSRLRRGYNGGPAGGYRKYRSTGNLSGKPHLKEAKVLLLFGGGGIC